MRKLSDIVGIKDSTIEDLLKWGYEQEASDILIKEGFNSDEAKSYIRSIKNNW